MSGRASSSFSPWPSGSPGPSSSRRDRARRILGFLLRLAVLTPILFYLWSFAQGGWSTGVASATNLLLAVEEHGRRVTTLVPDGSRIDVHSTLREDGLPANIYDADLLHFPIVLAVSLVLAYPGLSLRGRAAFLAILLPSIFAFQALTLLVTVEHTYAVVLQRVAERNYTPREAGIYRSLYETMMYLRVAGLPAAVFLILYAGSLAPPRPSKAEPPPSGRSLPPIRRARAAIAAAVAALVLLGGAAIASFHQRHVRARQAESACLSGWRALKGGEIEQATRDFREATAEKPRFLEAWDGLGQTLSRARGFSSAEEAFRRALAIDPSYLPSLLGLGGALLEEGRSAAAIDSYGRAAEIHPDRWEAQYDLAQALIADQRRAEAEAPLRRAAALNPEMPEIRWELADTLITTHRLCEAIPHLRALAALQPDSPHADLVRESLREGEERCGK